MKTFKHVSLLATALLLIIVSGCQQDDVAPLEEPKATIRRIVTAEDIPEVKQTLLEKIGLANDASLFSANTGETTSQLKIDWDWVKQLIDTTGRETYAFGLEDLDDEPQTFYNLIMKFNADHQAHRPYILKYTMADDFVEEYNQTGSLTDFRGTVQKILINQPATNTPRGSASLDINGDGLSVGEPCPDETPIGGGNTGGGGNDENRTWECRTYVTTEYWYTTVCYGGECETRSEIIGASVTTECDWADGSTSSDNNNDCEPDEGEVPMITPIRSPCDLMTTRANDQNFKNKLTYLKNNTSLIREVGFFYNETESGTSFSGVLQGLNGVHELGYVNIPSPIDGIMHTHFSGGLSVFSPQDLVTFFGLYQDGLMNNVNSFSFQIVTASGTRYSLAIDDEALFLAFGASLLIDADILSDLFNRFYKINTTNDAITNEVNFLGFLQTNNSGLTLMSANNSFTKWSKIELGESNTINKTTCN